jgi:hypothetical protein
MTSLNLTSFNKTSLEALPWRPDNLPKLRAAYSDRTAALMAFLADFAYHPQITGKSANVPDELASLGFHKLSVFANGLTDGFAFIAESDALNVLSFRGTHSKANWNTNFRAGLINPKGTDPNLRVHEGFYGAFQGLSEDGLSEKIAAINKTSGNIPFYVTGHSLGGALAQIAAAVFGSDRLAACYTFGSPRVGNAIFDLWVKAPSYRVINHADLVPQVPLPIFYRHSGDPRYLPAKVSAAPYRHEPGFFERVWQWVEGFVQLARRRGALLEIEDHKIRNYMVKLDQIANKRNPLP